MLFGIVYPIVGVLFALPANSASPEVRFGWRLAAWLVSAATFAVHIAYEHRLRRSSFDAAMHVAAAVAMGAFLLAVWINVHAHWVGATTRQSPLTPLALVVFPVVTGVPAFVVAFLAAAALARIRREPT